MAEVVHDLTLSLCRDFSRSSGGKSGFLYLGLPRALELGTKWGRGHGDMYIVYV